MSQLIASARGQTKQKITSKVGDLWEQSGMKVKKKCNAQVEYARNSSEVKNGDSIPDNTCNGQRGGILEIPFYLENLKSSKLLDTTFW